MNIIYRTITLFLALSLCLQPVIFTAQVHAQSAVNLPVPGTLLLKSPVYNPPMVNGLTIYPDNPFKFDFIVDHGDAQLNDQEFKIESEKLIKYFLAALTIPEEDLWVNLSPYEKNRIIPEVLGQTEMGMDLLAQDYILKQLSSSLMFPEEKLGNEFWKRVSEKTQERFGTTEIPMDTFNKIWIVPDKAVIYVQDNSVYVAKSRLKVMLEEDYLALAKQNANTVSRDKTGSQPAVYTEILKEILIPEIEREVNEGEMFAPLRQIYNASILATWFKQNLKNSLLGEIYVNQKRVSGIELEDNKLKEDIYGQYVQAFKKGVYNYIKEEYDEQKKEFIPRKYFSGGAMLGKKDLAVLSDEEGQAAIESISQRSRKVTWQMQMVGPDDEVSKDSYPIQGSPAQFLNTVRNDNYLLTGLLKSSGIRTKEMFSKRRKKDGTQFHSRTIEKEIKTLTQLGILMPVEGKKGMYRFSNAIRDLIDANFELKNIQILIDQINALELKVGEKGDVRPLHRFEIPQARVLEVKRAVTDIIKTLGRKQLRMIVVAGSFDDNGGRKSSIIAQLHAALPAGTTLINGGYFDEIHGIIEGLKPYDVVMWFPNIPNDKDKDRDIKDKYPQKILITSKRNHNNQYTLRDIANHALKLKSNLVVEFSDTVPFNMRLIDPLGNSYEDTKAPETLAKTLVERLEIITSIKRQKTKLVAQQSPVPLPQDLEFFRIIKERAGVFHQLMQSREETSSDDPDAECFRCERGFPSIREGDFIFVSKRDFAPNERFVSEGDLVPVDLRHYLSTDEIAYYGSNKPAVDTPIQMRLYKTFPRAKYILHSHEYIKGAPLTEHVNGSEALQEFDEIIKVIGSDPNTVNVAINLKGHGSVVIAQDLNYLESVTYEARSFLNEKTQFNAIVVGGKFDRNGGQPSEIIARLAQSLPNGIKVKNGGSLEELDEILSNLAPYEIVMWFPQVSEGEDLKLRQIKQKYPFKVLIAAMFNPDGRRPFQDMINSALGVRSNLFVEFRNEGQEQLRLYDPLSNQFTDTSNAKDLGQAIVKRVEALKKFTRQGTMSIGEDLVIPPSEELDAYLDIIRNYGDRFHDLVHPAEGVERFLGNTAFRASHFFPNNPELDKVMFISQRNVDKRNIGRGGFVGIRMDSYDNPRISFYGGRKPSVDTPTQVRFLDKLPNVNYILHAHVYIEGAPFTHELIPCGSCEEVDEVLTAIGHDYTRTNFAVNLLGHGSIIFAQDLNYLGRNIRYTSRPTPESLALDGKPVDFIKRLSDVLERFSPDAEKRDETKIDSGVILALRQIEGKWHFLLTKRASQLSYYADHWVIPGGRIDSTDASIREGAMREFFEETGINLRIENVIGRLNYEDTLDKHFRIFPYIAVLNGPANLQPNRNEVQDEEWIPVEALSAESITINREGREEVINVAAANQRILNKFAQAVRKAGDRAALNNEVIQLSDGTQIFRKQIEGMFVFSKYVNEVKLIGEGKPYVTALLVPNMQELALYAQEHNIYYVRGVDLINHPEIQNLLWSIVEKINTDLHLRLKKIHKIAVLQVPLPLEPIIENEIIEQLYSEENRDARVIVEASSISERRAAIERAKSQTSFELEQSSYFESEEFARQTVFHNFPEQDLGTSAFKAAAQEFKLGRSDHYSRLLGLRFVNGTKLYRTMEDFFVGDSRIKFYRITFDGKLAGRIVVNEETKTLVDALIFEPFRGNNLGDVVIEYLKEHFGQFSAIVPSDVPIYNFLKKRGFNVVYSQAIGAVNLDVMRFGPMTPENLEAVKKLHASIRNNYANALLDDLSDGEHRPEESALYKNFPQIYDLLYERFAKRLGDFIGIVGKNTPAGGSILDGAAGTGEVSVPLLKAGYDVLSADLNPGMLEQLKKKAQSRDVTPNTTVSDFLSFAKLEKQFDTITVRQAINYLITEDVLRQAFQGFHSRLKSKGRFIFNAPNYNPQTFKAPVRGPDWIKLGSANAIVWENNSINEQHVLTHHQQAIVWDDNTPAEVHYFHDINTFEMYTKDQFERILKEAGFSEIIFLSSEGKPYDPNDPVLYVIAGTDRSVLTPAPGGIDLNPNLLDLKFFGQMDIKLETPFTSQQIEHFNIKGFQPVIINIAPANNPQFLKNRNINVEDEFLSRL